MKGKIYKITNKINGKIYVGQTTKSLNERFQKHCWGTTQNDKYHLNMAIKKAIKKYGKENFAIELIEEVELDKLDERDSKLLYRGSRNQRVLNMKELLEGK